MISEHSEQCAIFQWATLSEKKHPDIKYMFSTLNGIKLSIGSAVKAKRTGNKSGVPDIVLPVSRGGYFGLYIELKVGKNRASKTQKMYMEHLKSQGYKAEIVWGADDAIEMIDKYMNMQKTRVAFCG